MDDATLKALLPGNKDVAKWTPAINETLLRFDITTKLRQAHFLAQLAVESAEFTRLEENLNYSALRLTQVWPARFPTMAAALPYHRRPEALANKVYSDRLGNGAVHTGDGWRYRGRGLIQVTGRANYTMAGKDVGRDLLGRPELLLEPRYAALSAGGFWARNGLNAIADKDDVTAVTRRVNGGHHGLDQRRAYLKRAKELL